MEVAAARGVGFGAPSQSSGSSLARLRQLYRQYGAGVGYALAALAVYLGWIGRYDRHLTAESGLGYALGIAGATAMGILLLYPARKRVAWLRSFGATRHWFRAHMILGIVGPVLILYHSNFELGSLNSRVALFCTLLVAGSGIIGRYLYAQIHHGLYGRKTTLNELLAELEDLPADRRGGIPLVAELRDELRQLGQRVLDPPGSLAAAVWRPVGLGFQARWLGWRLRRQIRRQLKADARRSRAIAGQRPRLEAAARRYVRDHLLAVRRVASFGLYERLFALWHIVHVPFFLLMVLSAVLHIVAVHLY